MKEIWISFHSVARWTQAQNWTAYFQRVDELLAAPLTHLDTNDPIRRKVSSLHDAGEYICAFGPHEDSRWLFGRFKSLGIDFSIRHFRKLDRWDNSFSWHIPARYCAVPGRWETIKQLFVLGNDCLTPFYSYADTSDTMAALAEKKKDSGACDPETELLGVFWLTYFCPAYVKFFGPDRFVTLPGVKIAADGSATIQLAETPQLLSPEERNKAVLALGQASFVDMADGGLKRRGQYALTFEQLAVRLE